MQLQLATIIVVLICIALSHGFLIFKDYSLPEDSGFLGSKYDFIIVGAGSSGSVLANRLSENEKWRILLLEAGHMQSFLNEIPILVSYFQLTDYDWGYNVEPQENACLGMIKRQCAWPRGKALGGTSTLNYMIHTRGNKKTYDEWASLGNTGWSYADVLPYFKKSERFNVPGKFTFMLIAHSLCTYLILPEYTLDYLYLMLQQFSLKSI